MKTQIYTIFDSKGEMYNQPFFQRNLSVAIRTFTTLANDEKGQIAQYPEDYFLYHIAEWDDVAGTITNLAQPVSCGKALDFVKKEGQLSMLEENK